MPYAAKATVEHEFLTNLLEIYVTFRHPMHISSEPLTTPPVWNIMPPLSLWILKADTVTKAIIASEWLDLWTLKLTSAAIATRPAIVELEYEGPNVNLSTAWLKQWEAFGPIPSTDLTATLWKTGMIILWSGSIVLIPSGWTLCDGTVGTPDLRNKFIVGAGDTYAPAASGGALTHTHGVNLSVTGGLITGNRIIDSAPNGQLATTFTAGGYVTTNSANHLPPYYALCYIMKL